MKDLTPYHEIGEALGISGEAVRKIEIRALKKLRKALEEAGLKDNDLIDKKAPNE
jgi:DNA-directed RNA polymerase sigma subunit (sigma70/sigma32)